MMKQAAVSRFCFQLPICLFCVVLSAVYCGGQKSDSFKEPDDSALVWFLQNELADRHDEADKTSMYSSAIIKSDGISKDEIVVYITGKRWCGSGGCKLWILEPDGASFKVIGKLTIVQLPIRLLRTKSHGHFDLSAVVAGGGTQPGYEAILRFDGVSYPGNPSVAPAEPLNRRVAGRVLIAEGVQGKLLYK